MQLSKVHKHILYTLGSWYAEAGKKLSAELELSIPKSVFIQALMSAGIAGKKERALYRNLELLEKKKLISYENKSLSLTARGEKEFQRIAAGVQPYLDATIVLKSRDPLSYARRVQTKLR